MVTAGGLCAALTRAGFGPFVGVPCSILAPLLARLHREPSPGYVATADEGEALGLAAGAALCGRRPVVLMQNSGLLNALNPIASLHQVFGLPCLLLVSHRGEPGHSDTPEHEVTGRITLPLLELLKIEHECLHRGDEGATAQVVRFRERISRYAAPHALIVRHGTLAPEPESPAVPRPRALVRSAAIRLVVELLGARSVFISTTGKISREAAGIVGAAGPPLFTLLGSMGCAAPVGFGVACERPNLRVVVLDGDGAALMKLGSLTTIGRYRPPNLLHVVLDNELYESTGGQPTATAQGSLSLADMARVAGYTTVAETCTAVELRAAIDRVLASAGPHLVVVKVAGGSDPSLPRVEQSPAAIRDRFMQSLSS
jgi:phosphonopyruvate decarboxylase